MTEHVVHFLEVVDIEEDDRAGELRAARLDKRGPELIEERAPIEQAGERIGSGEADQLGLVQLALDGKTDRPQEPAGIEVVPADAIGGAVAKEAGGGGEVDGVGNEDDRQPRAGAMNRHETVDLLAIRQPRIDDGRVETRIDGGHRGQRVGQRADDGHAAVKARCTTGFANGNTGCLAVIGVACDRQD